MSSPPERVLGGRAAWFAGPRCTGAGVKINFPWRLVALANGPLRHCNTVICLRATDPQHLLVPVYKSAWGSDGDLHDKRLVLHAMQGSRGGAHSQVPDDVLP